MNKKVRRVQRVEQQKGIFTSLCDAVALYYKEKGDKTYAGVVAAYLPDRETNRYYASVARYPDGPFGRKQIVAHGYASSAEKAIHLLADEWYKTVRGGASSVEAALDQLEERL